MSRALTVSQLREALEDYDDDQVVLAVHQANYPLAEEVKGLYLSGGSTCEECGVSRDQHESDPLACGEYDGPAEDAPAVLWLVLDGHPSEGSPYGPKRAFDEMERF